MRELALVGLANSRVRVHDYDCEVWTLNNAEAYSIPRITRLFDLHSREELIALERWQQLRDKERDYPVYLLEASDEIPNSFSYPRELVSEQVFKNLYVGDEQTEHYTSTFDYLLALAVVDNPDLEVIHVIGFEFGSDTEYKYQREGAHLLIGWAAGRGIKVNFPSGSTMLSPTVYGYEEYQMISRQTLESYLTQLAAQNSAAVGELNVMHERVTEAEKTNGDPDAIQELIVDRNTAFKNAYMTAGAMKLCDHLIRECDRRAGVLEFDDPLFRVNEEGEMIKATAGK